MAAEPKIEDEINGNINNVRKFFELSSFISFKIKYHLSS